MLSSATCQIREGKSGKTGSKMMELFKWHRGHSSSIPHTQHMVLASECVQNCICPLTKLLDLHSIVTLEYFYWHFNCKKLNKSKSFNGLTIKKNQALSES